MCESDCVAPPVTRFAAWQPLLLRTLRSYLLDRPGFKQLRTKAIISILAVLPVSPDSSNAISDLLPLLREHLSDHFPWQEALSCVGGEQEQEDDDSKLFTPSAPCPPRRPTRPPRRNRGARQPRDSGAGCESEDDRPVRRAKRVVHISECFLLSDSDGMAASLSDRPPADPAPMRVDDATLFQIYRLLFGRYPSVLPLIDCLVDALILSTNLSQQGPVKRQLRFLATNFSADSPHSAAQVLLEEGGSSAKATVYWLNWLRVSRQACRSAAHLALFAHSQASPDKEGIAKQAIDFIVQHGRQELCACQLVSSLFQSGCVADESLTSAALAGVRVAGRNLQAMLDLCFSLIALLSQDKRAEQLMNCGQLIDANEPELVESAVESVMKRFFSTSRGADRSAECRFAYELCDSMIDSPDLVSLLLAWLLRLPSGLCGSVAGVELLSTLVPLMGVDQHSHACAAVVKRHMPHVAWQVEERGEGVEVDTLETTTQASKAVVRLSQLFRNTTNIDTMFHFAGLLFPHCSSVDLDYVLVDAVIPKLVELLEKYEGMEEGEGALDSCTSWTLKCLEIVSAHVKTAVSAKQLIDCVLVPHSSSLDRPALRDVWMAATARAARLDTHHWMSTGGLDHVLSRIGESCVRAELDCHTFWSRSAVAFSRQLSHALHVLREAAETSGGDLRPSATRIVEACRPVLNIYLDFSSNPPSDASSARRAAGAAASALGVMVMMEEGETTPLLDSFLSQVVSCCGNECVPASVLLSHLPHQLLEHAVNRAVPLGKEPVEEGADDQLMGESGWPFTRSVLLPDVVVLAMRTATRLIHTLETIAESQHFVISRLCARLSSLDRRGVEEQGWMEELFALGDALAEKKGGEEAFGCALSVLCPLLARFPSSEQLMRLVRYFHGRKENKPAVLAALSRLLPSGSAEPTDCLVFPQQPLENAEEMRELEEGEEAIGEREQEEEGEEEEVEGSRSLLDRLVPRSRWHSVTDDYGEEKERREREKEKRKREVTSPPSSASLPWSAAQLTLSDGHRVVATDGLTLSVWIKALHRKQSAHRWLHLVSIGGRELECCVRVCPRNGTVKMTMSGGEGGAVGMASHRVRGSLPHGKWTHVLLAVRLSQEAAHVEICVGDQWTSLTVPLIVKIRPLSFPLTVGFGSRVEPPTAPHYFMSNVFGFKGVLPASCRLVLQSLGAGLSSLAETRMDVLVPVMAHVVTRRLVCEQRAPLEAVLADVGRHTHKLQRGVVFVVRASSAATFAVSVLPADLDPRDVIAESALSLAHMKDHPVSWCTRVVTRFIPSVDTAIQPVGGMDMIVYLYVKTVNDGLSGATQLEALRLLLAASKRGGEMSGRAASLRISRVIARVLASELAVLNEETIELILSECVNYPHIHPGDVHLDSTISVPSTVRDPWQAVLTDPCLLLTLLERAEVWRGERFSVYCSLVQQLSVLVDESTCQLATFNRERLAAEGGLARMTVCLLELCQSPSSFCRPPDEEAFVEAVLTIVAPLLGNPYKVECVAQLWHFVFLSHPAAHLYVDHRVTGHSGWLRSEPLRDEHEGELLGESRLARKMRQYMNVLGKDHMVSEWKSGASLFQLRRQFEEKGGEVGAVGGGGGGGGGLPDMVADLRHDSSASTSTSDGLVYEAPARKEERGKEECDWVVRLRAGAMRVLVAVLQNGSDAVLACMRHDFISWQAIVVMQSQQRDPAVREAAVAMLEHFLLRAPPFTKVSFLSLSGFQVLAAQLSLHGATQSIADSLFSIMLGETVRLADGLDDSHLCSLSVDRVSCDAMHAVLVCWRESAGQVALFWNVTNALVKIFDSCSQLQQAMVAAKLADAMVGTLRRVAEIEPESDSDIYSTTTPISPQMECWARFAQRVVIATVPFSDPSLMACCERVLWLLQMADCDASRAAARQGADGKARDRHARIRGQLCLLLHCWLESIRTCLSDEGRSASAAASIDSLYFEKDRGSGSTSPSSASSIDFCDEISAERAGLLEGTSPVAAFIAGSFANLREKISHLAPISRRSLRAPFSRRRGPAPLAPPTVLTERIGMALDAAATVFSVFDTVWCEEEEMLFHFQLYFMLSAWKRHEQQSSRSAPSAWQRLVASSRDKARVLLAQMVAFVLFPAQEKMRENRGGATEMSRRPCDVCWSQRRRRVLLRALAHECGTRQQLAQLLSVNLDYEYALSLGVYELCLLGDGEEGDESDRSQLEEDASRVVRCLASHSVIDTLTPDSLNNLTTDEMLSMHAYSQHRKSILSQLRGKLEAIREGEATANAQVAEMAMSVTCEVVEQQGTPRKTHMKRVKELIGEGVRVERAWQAMVTQLCHPLGACYEPRHYPIGRALDSAEGPARERRRMRVYEYPFERRFFREPRRSQIEQSSYEHPLANLLAGSAARVGGEQLAVDGLVVCYLEAILVSTATECAGELLIGEKAIHFVGHSAKSTQKGVVSSEVVSASWRFSQLSEMTERKHLLQDVAVEWFTTEGSSHLVVFQSTEKRALFKSQLCALGLDHLFLSTDQQLAAATAAWRQGDTTNFQYLMCVNKLAGRSFNDLMQYPVFPFVLADYSSPQLDLTDARSYRNLWRPMAVQDRKMEAHYQSTYDCLAAETARQDRSCGPLHFGPYHYGSHYSNSGIVTHYLVRLSPFTQIALEYQDNNFDIADRLFNSIEATWRLASSESTTDFKELIPEFFYLPEFLENGDCLEMGTRQAGQVVDKVQLPRWVGEGGDARLFTLIHRQALESAAVTASLHAWIDLIFGYKQTGAAARQALNVFHPATYAGGLDIDSMDDEVAVSAVRAMVRSYGQMPRQLLHAPHQPHLGGVAGGTADAPAGRVTGIRWGDYAGSPTGGAPECVLSVKTAPSDRLSRLVRFPDGQVAGCSRDCIVIAAGASSEQLWSVGWQWRDGVVRARAIRPTSTPWVNAMRIKEGAEVVCMEHCASTSTVWTSHSNGIVAVYEVTAGVGGVSVWRECGRLLAHQCAVGSLAICDPFSLAATGDVKGIVCLWDTTSRRVLLSLPAVCSSIALLCFSRVSADLLTVWHDASGSRIRLNTCTGRLAGEAQTDVPITCVAMTDQPEGAAVNCAAVGMHDGSIRLYEMWCLTHVRTIQHDTYMDPVISVEFGSSGRRLFCAQSGGRVLCWQNAPVGKGKPPPFQMINPYF